MSASQQARNKKLHEQIDRLKAELVFSNKTVERLEARLYDDPKVDGLQNRIRQLDAENSRLLHLIPQAWSAGQRRLASNIYLTEQPDLKEWMKQKGLK